MSVKLSTTNHDRNVFKDKYIYPVVSRRAGGLSLGINLNTNNACNWQCVYCEVPNLTRGKPEPINLSQLEKELIYWLDQIVHQDFLKEHTETGTSLKDIAFSGNGEPTAAKEFGAAIKIVMKQTQNFQLKDKVSIRLITNGSYINLPETQNAWMQLSDHTREIWFKIDTVDSIETKIINQVNLSIKSVTSNLEAALKISPVTIQSCFLKIDGHLPSEQSINKYIDFIKPYAKELKGIHLYSLARPTKQNTSLVIERLSESELSAIAGKIKQLNIPVLSFI